MITTDIWLLTIDCYTIDKHQKKNCFFVLSTVSTTHLENYNKMDKSEQICLQKHNAKPIQIHPTDIDNPCFFFKKNLKSSLIFILLTQHHHTYLPCKLELLLLEANYMSYHKSHNIIATVFVEYYVKNNILFQNVEIQLNQRSKQQVTIAYNEDIDHI
jgi:hypothetical protein